MSRERWMALFFALGSTCFFIGPFPGYAQLVGATADAVTFFIGSVLFTAGGALQSAIAFPERRSDSTGRAAWRNDARRDPTGLGARILRRHALPRSPCRSPDAH